MPMGIDPYHGVSKENKATILEFRSDLLLEGLSDKTIGTYSTLLCVVARTLGNTPFKQATEEQMKDFFRNCKLKPGSQETLKITVKRFYRWLFKLQSDEPLPVSVRWIKFQSKRAKRREIDPDADAQHLVTEAEYTALITVAERLQNPAQTRAFLEVFRFYGPRVSELLSMTIGGVTSNTVGVEITIYKSKTEPRKITSEKIPKHLLAWLDMHPNRGYPNRPLWVNFDKDSRVYMKRLGECQIRNTIHELCKLAGITKNIHPHLFRHTCISEKVMLENMPPALAAAFFGVSIQVIDSVYLHNRSDFLLRWQTEQRKQRGEIAEPTKNELMVEKQKLEEQYARKFAEMEARMDAMNKMIDSEMHRGYLAKTQQLEQRAEAEERARYERGEL